MLTIHTPQTYVIKKPNGTILTRPEGQYWRFALETWEDFVEEKAVIWGEGASYPMVKRYLANVQNGLVPVTIFNRGFAGDNSLANSEVAALLGVKRAIEYPKPTLLIKRLLQISTEPSDGELVLDFFAGSGTTAHAVLDLNREDAGNRRFIMVQLPQPTNNPQFPTIADIGRERIRRVIQKMKTEQNGKLPLDEREEPEDLGFRAFRLAESNFEAWDGAIAAGDDARLEEQIAMRVEHVRAGRTHEDLLYEIVLRCGIPLTATVEKREAAGVSYYAVADGALFACVADKVSAEALRAMIGDGPQLIVCLDCAFDGNDQVKTNIWLEARDRGVQFRTI